MNPEILELVRLLLIAVIPILFLFLGHRYLKDIEDRELTKKAIEFAWRLSMKFVDEGSDLAEIIDVVASELLKALEKLSKKEATIYATGAVLRELKEDDERLREYRKRVIRSAKMREISCD